MADGGQADTSDQGSRDRRFMRLALAEAEAARALGEVPVGCVIVRGDEVIGQGHNRRETAHDPTAHAEMLAIVAAARALKGWRLEGTTLYVTLEPCVMCAGAMVLARIPRLVFGPRDPKAGAVGSLYDIPRDARLNHRVEVCEGVLAEEGAEQLRSFFRGRRDGTVARAAPGGTYEAEAANGEGAESQADGGS